MHRPKFLAAMSALTLLLAVASGYAEDPVPAKPPAPGQKADQVDLPLHLTKDTQATYRVTVENIVVGKPTAGDATETRTTEYRIQVRDVKADGTTLSVELRPQSATMQDPQRDAEGDGDASAPQKRDLVVKLDAEGNIRDVSEGTLSPQHRNHLQLILGAGLHGEKLSTDSSYSVGGLELQPTRTSPGDATKQVAFTVEREGSATPQSRTPPQGHAPDLASMADRATYDAKSGLLKKLEIRDADAAAGSQSLEIQRVKMGASASQPTEDDSEGASQSTCNPDHHPTTRAK